MYDYIYYISNSFGHQIFNNALKIVRINIVTVEGFNTTGHEIEVRKFSWLGSPSRICHLLAIFFDPFYLLVDLRFVVIYHSLSFLWHFVVLAAKNGIKNLSTSFLAVIDAEAYLHILWWLQVTSCQSLKEVKDYVNVSVFILVTILLNGLLCFLATFDEL